MGKGSRLILIIIMMITVFMATVYIFKSLKSIYDFSMLFYGDLGPAGVLIIGLSCILLITALLYAIWRRRHPDSVKKATKRRK